MPPLATNQMNSFGAHAKKSRSPWIGRTLMPTTTIMLSLLTSHGRATPLLWLTVACERAGFDPRMMESFRRSMQTPFRRHSAWSGHRSAANEIRRYYRQCGVEDVDHQSRCRPTVKAQLKREFDSGQMKMNDSAWTIDRQTSVLTINSRGVRRRTWAAPRPHRNASRARVLSGLCILKTLSA
jgi:hypothetical protein